MGNRDQYGKQGSIWKTGMALMAEKQEGWDGEKGEFGLQEVAQLGSQITRGRSAAYKLMIHLEICSFRGPQGRI